LEFIFFGGRGENFNTFENNIISVLKLPRYYKCNVIKKKRKYYYHAFAQCTKKEEKRKEKE
jgi:hypothetical protein